MDLDNYLNFKLHNAKNHIIDRFGNKHYYSKEDVLDLLKEFGSTFETDLINLFNYVPTKGNDFTNIKAFTKGFIDNEDASIYVLILDKHFEVFVFDFQKNMLANYYSLNINDKVLEICYYLEAMKFVDKI